MIQRIFLTTCFLSVLMVTKSQYCQKDEKCPEDTIDIRKDVKDYKKLVAHSMSSYEPYKSDNKSCSCYMNVLKDDFAPFNKGITKELLESVKSRGTIYQIIDNKIYRQKDCHFPARCSGIEYFIKKVLTKVKLPNMELVINVRDYPQIDSTYGPQGPVLSFSKTKDYLDILYPAWSFYEGGPAIKLYPTGLGRFDKMRESLRKAAEKFPWEKKKTKAFFRGSRTSDERDSLVVLSRSNQNLADAQYTKNQAWKSPEDTLGREPSEEVSLEDHCQYKFLFNYRGVAASFRFKHLFLCKSLVFHVGDEWNEFYYALLKPWVHYIPVDSKSTPEDLKDMIEFFKNNQSIAKEIAERGYEIIWNHLSLDDVECYWRRLLRKYGNLMKFEVTKDPGFIRIM